MSKVEVNEVFKEYELGDRTVNALSGVSFVMEDSTFVTVVGKSGCGKTTLLRIICGLETASGGTIRFSGNGDGQVRPRVSIVFQEPRLMPWLTVEQNVAFALAREPDREQVREVVAGLLKLLGLTEFKDAYPSQISGGMAQRVALGRTLCFNPDVILMDEPFGALDAFTRRNLQLELVNIFRTQKKTILFVTHDVDEAIFLGKRVLVLDQGRLVKEILVNLDYPRDPLSRECYDLREEILSFLFRDGKTSL
jgi:sulfonate transport system ATP-binding protein